MSQEEITSSGCFPTTQWTQVIAIMQDGSEAAAWEALGNFCEQYRPAIQKFFIRRGCTVENAMDFTQEFFLSRILVSWEARTSFLHQARRSEDGRFRSFLCWLLWHFLRDQLKKGGERGGNKAIHISLEEWLLTEEGGEAKICAQFGREFDRAFALDIIQKAAAQSNHSECLMAHLRGEQSQKAAADALGISEEAFKVAYHRFRVRLAEQLWEEVSKVAGPDEKEIQAEIRHLMSVFASPKT